MAMASRGHRRATRMAQRWRRLSYSMCNTLVLGLASPRIKPPPASSLSVSARSLSSASPQGPASALLDPNEIETMVARPRAPVKIVDASWHMPASKRIGKAEFLEGPRVPKATFFDIDEACDKSSSLPHMLPTAQEFSAYAESLGISSADTVVLYDTLGMFSAPRVWWMFRYFGHDNVFVLNGGLPAWMAEGKALDGAKIETLPPYESKGGFKAEERKDMVASLDAVKGIISSGGPAILDARSAGRFTGEVPDPRGVRPGHMPASVNVPMTAVLDDQGRMLPEDQLASLFEKIDLKNGAVTSCGSGVTACIISLALHEAGYRGNEHQVVYDGSWAEWGSEAGGEVLTGP